MPTSMAMSDPPKDQMAMPTLLPTKKGPGRPRKPPTKKYPAIKATTYSQVGYLKRMKPRDVGVLDFTGFIEKWGVEEIDKLFPKETDFGKHDPPASYLIKGEKIRKWRRMSEKEQKNIMEQDQEELIEEEQGRELSHLKKKRQEMSAVITAAENRRIRRRIMMEREKGNEKWTLPSYEAAVTSGLGTKSKCASSSSLRNLADAANCLAEAAEGEGHSESTNTTTTTTNNNSAPSSPDIVQKTKHKRKQTKEGHYKWDCPRLSACCGITLQIIRDKRGNDKDVIEKGFFHLVGNAGRYKSHVISNTGKWNYDHTVVGFLVGSNNHTSKNKEDSHNNNTTTPNNNNDDDDLDFRWKCMLIGNNQWSFHRNTCDNTTSAHYDTCERCWEGRNNLYVSCRDEVAMRDSIAKGKAVKGRIDLMKFKSPDIVLHRLEDMSKQIVEMRKGIYKLQGEKERIGVVEGEIQL